MGVSQSVIREFSLWHTLYQSRKSLVECTKQSGYAQVQVAETVTWHGTMGWHKVGQASMDGRLRMVSQVNGYSNCYRVVSCYAYITLIQGSQPCLCSLSINQSIYFISPTRA